MGSIVEKRKSLDKVDEQILLLLAERFRITDEIGLIKSRQNLPSKDSGREAETFMRLEKIAQENGLDKELVNDLWRKIIDRVVKNHDLIKRNEASKNAG